MQTLERGQRPGLYLLVAENYVRLSEALARATVEQPNNTNHSGMAASY